MDCAACREAVSARLDGHDTEDPDVDTHLARCAECQAWRADVVALAHRIDLHCSDPVPDLSATVLAALAEEDAMAETAARQDALRPWQVGLATLGTLQLLLAVPVLLFGSEPGAGVHVAREMGSFDVALAVGFLFAAWRPARAWGMVPLVAALAGCLAHGRRQVLDADRLQERDFGRGGQGARVLFVLGAPAAGVVADEHHQPPRAAGQVGDLSLIHI